MRKADFEVPSEVMEEFTDAMVNRDLDNTITGTTEEGDIIIEVQYERNEAKAVDELENVLADLCEQLEKEEEEDER